MQLVDANVLLHSVNVRAREHHLARRWVGAALSGDDSETVGFAWGSLLAFLRLATHPAIFPRPLTGDQAIAVVEEWLASSRSIVVEPTRRHLAILRGLLTTSGTAGNLVSDAHLAALALEHGATIVSFDRDFGRFAGVRWRVPA